MPVYEFVCPECKTRFEEKHPVTAVPFITKCPECGTESPKVFSRFSFQFSPYLKELREGNMLDY